MVLQGQTDLASIVFPQNVYGRELDVRARSFLWKKVWTMATELATALAISCLFTKVYY